MLCTESVIWYSNVPKPVILATERSNQAFRATLFQGKVETGQRMIMKRLHSMNINFEH